MLKDDLIAKAIDNAFISPNCLDSNLEPANIVDGLYAIAKAIKSLADAAHNKNDRAAFECTYSDRKLEQSL